MPSRRTTEKDEIPAELIAPCGMNCRLCRAYVRDKKACPGCRGGDRFKSKACVTCRIKNCEKLAASQAGHCFDCGSYPCAALTHLDKRYRAKYGMSMIDNLEYLKQFGTETFIEHEKARWSCAKCGAIVCVHKENCISCGYKWR